MGVSLKVYHMHGIRHQAVVFALSPEEAVTQAIERGLVGDWEAPDAAEVPLPHGYRLVYDPLAAAEQSAATLAKVADSPGKSGVLGVRMGFSPESYL